MSVAKTHRPFRGEIMGIGQHRRGAPQRQAMRSGNYTPVAGALSFNPWFSTAIVESRSETGAHNDAPFESSHNADHARVSVIYRHKIGDGGDSIGLGIGSLDN